MKKEPVVGEQSANSLENFYVRRTNFYIYSKNLIDIMGSFFGILLLLPFFIGISILLKCEDNKASVIFRQKRIGQYGKPFYMYKFRSMVDGADEKLKCNSELYEKYLRNNYKLNPEEDPRITKVGKFLRKSSLDELPQLINVLKRDMSLIGPRPIVEVELNEYNEKKTIFLSVKPGITGYWQIRGRSCVGYPERTDLELYYIYNQCLLLDLKILLITIIIVFIRRGAY
ncbi:sugar transferase [Planococcus sp. YIM B11945]|uniref:sugar transferase n=1 Tax=Planococcus sp. YIM B11945 TaxID=3435410 RepID=UPI003D7DE549